jgi:hypothetical protein
VDEDGVVGLDDDENVTALSGLSATVEVDVAVSGDGGRRHTGGGPGIPFEGSGD